MDDCGRIWAREYAKLTRIILQKCLLIENENVKNLRVEPTAAYHDETFGRCHFTI